MPSPFPPVGDRATIAAAGPAAAARLANQEESRSAKLADAEGSSIFLLDENDKVPARSEFSGADVNRQNVQRDLLPLVESRAFNTKFGVVKTDHILFIANGAFHLAKPGELIPEQ